MALPLSGTHLQQLGCITHVSELNLALHSNQDITGSSQAMSHSAEQIGINGKNIIPVSLM